MSGVATGAPGVDLGTGPVGWEIAAWLSQQPLKRRLYGLDLYFREGWEELSAAAGSGQRVQDWLHAHTLILVKPDAVVRRRIDATVTWLHEHRIDIVAIEPVSGGRHVIRALWQYQWNIATPDRCEITELMMRQCDGLLFVVRMPDELRPAAARMADLKGPAVPDRQASHQLRWAIGPINYIINGVHSPDEPADVVRELSVLLDAEQRQRVYGALDTAGGSDPAPVILRSYAQVPPQPDLMLAARRDRWLRMIEAARAGTPAQQRSVRDFLADESAAPDRWRTFAAEMAWLYPDWGEWDTIVLGTSYARAHLPGVERILP